jgi:hypothetical protein
MLLKGDVTIRATRKRFGIFLMIPIGQPVAGEKI